MLESVKRTVENSPAIYRWDCGKSDCKAREADD